jgi:hypothetical protein
VSNCTKKVKTDECLQSRDEGYNECTAYRDDGYNKCNQTRDEGYNSCDDWGWFSFICIAWIWIKNIVCVAWEWIKNIVCVAWEWVKSIVCVVWKYIVQFVCVVIDILTTIFGIIMSIIDVVLGIIGGIVSFIVDIITSIPIIGRLIEWVINIGKSVVSFIVGLGDSILGLVGIMPEKKLFLMVIIQNDEQGNPLIQDRNVLYRSIQYLINTFRSEMNIRVLPVRLFQYNSAFADDPTANDDYIITESAMNTKDLIDVCCDECEAGQNLLDRGSAFNLKISRLVFLGGGRRVLGLGSPVVAFAVRSFTDGKAGCSLGPLSDFVTVRFSDSDTAISAIDLTADKSLGSITDLAHEVGHCCSLPPKDDINNLMNDFPNRRGGMTVWQKILVRSSRHASYL